MTHSNPKRRSSDLPNQVGHRNTAAPIPYPIVAATDRAATYRVQHLERGHQITCAVNLDLDIAVAYFINRLGQLLQAISQKHHIFGKSTGYIDFDRDRKSVV